MARYELRNVGVFDRELGRDIRPGDPEWPAYEVWMAEHENTPDVPPPTPPVNRFDWAAAGRARLERHAERVAEHDPVTAMLIKEGAANVQPRRRRPR